MFATQVLPEALSDDSIEGSDPEVIGFVIVEDKKYELKKGETKIGRDPSMCSIVIENFTISKVHAVIESEGVDDTFVYDAGSTNQTKLGKKILKPHCRYKLDNNSKLTLGNVTAKFVISLDENSDWNSQPSKTGKFDPLNELGDIFDVPTQVSCVQPITSSKAGVFGKTPDNFQIFKIPHSVSPAEASTSSKSCSEEDTQYRLDSKKSKQQTVYFADSFENSGIFSMGTQYQLYESPVGQEGKCAAETVAGDESNKNSESEKIKSLLNDGQDDVLCSFMSIHSPGEQGQSVKEINIRTELKGLTQVFDAPTQAQVEDRERQELSEILKSKDLTEDFSVASKPSVTSTPLNNKFLHPNEALKNDNTSTGEEDLIQTQQFNPLETRKDGTNSLSQDETETQPYLGDTLDELAASQQDEDLILTQTFEKTLQQKQPPRVVPESEEVIGEDFLQTQIFPFEKESRGEARVLPETPDRDVDTSFTHRNDEDDFIATQIFEEVTTTRNTAEKSDEDENKDDEDFIATQKVEFPASGTKRVDAACRESSPDFLASDSISKNFEDCISTQIFEAPPCLTTTTQQVSSREKQNVPHVPEPDNSGDETESDLEILLDETTKTGEPPLHKFIKSEEPENNPQTSQNDDSNSSYVFELEPENPSERAIEQNQAVELSDSDATDCEEIAMLSPKIQVKEEPQKTIEFEDTQVLTLTLPDFAEPAPVPKDAWMTGGADSPNFGGQSPLSLEMPNTQEIETTVNRFLRPEIEKEDSKTEVGITNGGIENQVDSPLKRPRDSNSGEVVPVKKSKTEASGRNSEKQFSKLVQAHDIAQIQPSRTRNSLKSLANENGVSLLGNNINERPTSRRRANTKKGSTKNPNGDITPYLTKKVERKRASSGGRQKDTPPGGNQPVEESNRRVLRSSTRNATPTNPPTRKRKRSSRTNENPSVNVVFTGFDCEVLDKIISDLGGRKINDLSSGDVVVADKVRRTVKFLSAIGLSLPIASPEWLLSCRKEKKFLNPWEFILKDEEAEEKWDFELKASLKKSKAMKLLEGFSIFATKSTKPPVKDLLAIVEFCGGTPLFDHPAVWPKKTIVVSCLEDKKWWPPPKLRNVRVVHYEFILTGVLRQKIDFKTYTLR